MAHQVGGYVLTIRPLGQFRHFGLEQSGFHDSLPVGQR